MPPQADSTQAFTGVVEFSIKLVNPKAPVNSRPVWSVPVKIWYRDSLAIEEVATLQSFTDSKNNTKTTIAVKNYRFVDLKKRLIYVYDNFSDTATMLKRYSFTDTTVETVGGWQFNTKKDSDYVGEPEKIADTTIDGQIYKRLKLTRRLTGVDFYSTLFFNCNARRSPFLFYPALSKQIGCPAVKFLSEYPNHGKLSTIEEIKFLRSEFTPVELRVFQSWAKNISE